MCTARQSIQSDEKGAHCIVECCGSPVMISAFHRLLFPHEACRLAPWNTPQGDLNPISAKSNNCHSLREPVPWPRGAVVQEGCGSIPHCQWTTMATGSTLRRPPTATSGLMWMLPGDALLPPPGQGIRFTAIARFTSFRGSDLLQVTYGNDSPQQDATMRAAVLVRRAVAHLVMHETTSGGPRIPQAQDVQFLCRTHVELSVS